MKKYKALKLILSVVHTATGRQLNLVILLPEKSVTNAKNAYILSAGKVFPSFSLLSRSSSN